MRRTKADLYDFETALDIASCIWNSLAMFPCQEFGKRIIFRLNQFQELAHDTHTALRVGGAPGWLRRLRILDGSTHFRRCCKSHTALNGPVHGLKDFGC